MVPPKRAFFSLNVDSKVESLHEERINHKNKGEDKKTVVDIDSPVQSKGKTHIEIVKNKSEKKIERTIEGFGLGLVEEDIDQKKVKETDNGQTYTTETKGSGPSSAYIATTTTTNKQDIKPKTSIDIDEQYDTSDL